MLNALIPRYVFDSIYEITPTLLRADNVRGVLIDLDGTMASRHEAVPSAAVADFLQQLLRAGIKVLVLSNNNETRVNIFCKELNIPYLHRALKPLRRGFLRGAAMLNLPISACAVIGDQIYTDTYGGNRVGAGATYYVCSHDAEDFWIHVRYQFEKHFIRRGKKQMEERMSGNGR